MEKCLLSINHPSLNIPKFYSTHCNNFGICLVAVGSLWPFTSIFCLWKGCWSVWSLNSDLLMKDCVVCAIPYIFVSIFWSSEQGLVLSLIISWPACASYPGTVLLLYTKDTRKDTHTCMLEENHTNRCITLHTLC